MFLQAGKFMPGMEKLAGELFFPAKGQLFFDRREKNSSFVGKKSGVRQLFHARHKFFSLEDEFSLVLADYDFGPLTQTMVGSVLYSPYKFR